LRRRKRRNPTKKVSEISISTANCK